MQPAQPFVVPEGVLFQIDADGVVIENRGDIVLHTNFGRPLKRVVSAEGSIEVHATVTGGLLQAAQNITVHGSLTVDGRVQAGGNVLVDDALSAPDVDATGMVYVGGNATVGSVRANAVQFRGGQVHARGVQGWSQVVIGEARVLIDAILAPEVQFAPKTSGRVTVVESSNELGPSAVKGCFRLSDYAEMFGDPNTFLAERGLMRLTDAPTGAPITPPSIVSASLASLSGATAPANVALPSATAPTVVPAPSPTPSESRPPAVEARTSLPPRVEESDHTEDRPAPAASVDDGVGALPEVEVEAAVDVVPARPTHPAHSQVEKAVAKVLEAYAGAEVPPAVERLHGLVEERAYDTIRTDITNIWQDLLRFHQKKGARLPPAVTTTFNTINSIVKKM